MKTVGSNDAFDERYCDLVKQNKERTIQFGETKKHENHPNTRTYLKELQDREKYNHFWNGITILTKKKY